MASGQESIEVDVPVSTAYTQWAQWTQWTQFETFPEFTKGVKAVDRIDETPLQLRNTGIATFEPFSAERTRAGGHTDNQLPR